MYSTNKSVLNQSQITLEIAKMHLNNYNNNKKTLQRNKSLSSFKSLLLTKPKSYNSPTINLIKPTRSKSKNNKFVSRQINNIIINNRMITKLNIKLSNKLGTLNKLNDIISNNNVYELKKELKKASEILKENLRDSNNRNFEILKSYEQLNNEVEKINEENKILEEELKKKEEENLKIKNSNLALKNNLNKIKINYEQQTNQLKESYYKMKKGHDTNIDKYKFLEIINKNLLKTKNDYKDLIYEMKSTIKILEKKRKINDHDKGMILNNLNEKHLEIGIRDDKLNNLQNNYELLKKENIEIDENLKNTLKEINYQENSNNNLNSVNHILKGYDMKVDELMNVIRERDKEIEDLKSQYSYLNIKFDFHNNQNYTNSNMTTKNNTDNKYSFSSIPEEINGEDQIEYNNNIIDINKKIDNKLNENNKMNIKNNFNSNIDNNYIKIDNKNNINDDKDDFKDENIINFENNINKESNNIIEEDIMTFDNLDLKYQKLDDKKTNNINNEILNDEKNIFNQNNDYNTNNIFNEEDFQNRKKYSKQLLEENKKLQEEYNKLLKDNDIPLLQVKSSIESINYNPIEEEFNE